MPRAARTDKVCLTASRHLASNPVRDSGPARPAFEWQLADARRRFFLFSDNYFAVALRNNAAFWDVLHKRREE